MMPTPPTDETSAAKANDLCDYAGRVPGSGARVVREAAQKQLDADLRAQDALLTRGNQLLALAGVAISLLVGLTKESAVDTWVEKVFLIGSLLAVMAAAALGVSALSVVARNRVNLDRPATAGNWPRAALRDRTRAP